MKVKTIKSYFDRESHILYSVKDKKKLIREVPEQRGRELIEKGYCVEVKDKK